MIWEDVSCSANTVQNLSTLEAKSRSIGAPSIVSFRSSLRFLSASQDIAEDDNVPSSPSMSNVQPGEYESVIIGTSSSLHKSEPEFICLVYEEYCEPEAIVSIPGVAEYLIHVPACHTDSALILPEILDVSTPRKIGREEDFVLPGNPLICSTPAAQNASVEDMGNHSNEAENSAVYFLSEQNYSSAEHSTGYSLTKHSSEAEHTCSSEAEHTCSSEAEVSAGYSLPTIDQSSSVSHSRSLVTCGATPFVLPHERHLTEIQESSDSDSDEQLEQRQS